MLEVDPGTLNVLAFDDLEVPVADLSDLEVAPTRLLLNGKVYQYVKSYLRKGYAAIAPRDIYPLLDAGKEVLMVERGERYYLYHT